MVKVKNVMEDDAIIEALSTLKLRGMKDAYRYQKTIPLSLI